MLLPQRCDDTLNVSPSSKSEVSIFALDHINFGGSANPSGPQVSISTECLSFGKVIDFIDGILLDRPDSYNRVLVNCLYGHGMVQLVLTTLVAASQLFLQLTKLLLHLWRLMMGIQSRMERMKLIIHEFTVLQLAMEGCRDIRKNPPVHGAKSGISSLVKPTICCLYL